MYSNVYDNKFINIKELIDNSEFEKAYNALKSISERCSKWYYLNSLSAMNLGYYEEGEESITKASEMDPENKDVYASNAATYQEKLSDLDTEYQNTVDSAKQNTLLFADRFAFRYLVDDYGLNYYAAFSGCSAESEASFKTVTFLADKLDELGLKTVLTIEKSDDRIAQTVIENTETKDQKILELNSMQSITSDEIADGVTYLSVMEDNLNVLKEALN